MHEIARWLEKVRNRRPEELLAVTGASIFAVAIIFCIACLVLGTAGWLLFNGSTERTGESDEQPIVVATGTDEPDALDVTGTSLAQGTQEAQPTAQAMTPTHVAPLPSPTAIQTEVVTTATVAIETPPPTLTLEAASAPAVIDSTVSTTTIEPINLPAPDSALEFTPTTQLTLSSVIFVENAGQFPDDVRFQVHGVLGGGIRLAADAIWITLVEPTTRTLPPPTLLTWEQSGNPQPDTQQGLHLRLGFEEANENPQLIAFDRLDTQISYFHGDDPTSWQTRAPVWGGVRYKNLYPGIDLELTSRDGQYIQRLIAQPGADLSAVRLHVEGAQGMALVPLPVADGGLEVGEGENHSQPGVDREESPSEQYYLQISNQLGEYSLPLLRVETPDDASAPLPTLGIPRIVPGSNIIEFPFVTIDSGKDKAGEARSGSPASTVTDDISPLIYSTPMGEGGNITSNGIAVDAAGCAFVAGHIYVPQAPFEAGIFDASDSGNYEAFLSKFKPGGNELAYGVFVGGDGDDQGTAVGLDRSGNAYLTGVTSSTNLPTTAGSFDTDHNGGRDIFVSKVNPAGSMLGYATYLGGSDDDWGADLAVDEAGNAYVVGSTGSSDFPSTTGAWDTTGDGQDAFVVKVNVVGSGLAYATFLGGSGAEQGNAIAVDSQGAAFATGSTRSSDFPVSTGAIDAGLDGDEDAFVVQLDPQGTELAYGSFFGGSGADRGHGIALDGEGHVYLAGATQSADLATTAWGFDTSYGGGVDVFVAKLGIDESEIVYASFLGGSGDDWAQDIAVDEVGHAYLTGSTQSFESSPTARALGEGYHDRYDAFVVRVDPLGVKLAFATFVGGSGEDHGRGIAIDALGNAYLAGTSNSSESAANVDGDAIQKAGYVQQKPDSVWDAFVSKVVVGTPFLDLPVLYSNFAQAALGNMNDDSLGRVNSWFDHSYPNHKRNQKIARWDGSTASFGASSPPLIGESWYDGHGGTDYRWEVHDEPIYAAAPGQVIDSLDSCQPGDQACGSYFGNRVWIDHGNGYASVYAHLGTVFVTEGAKISDPLAHPLGIMGNTGRSQGTHLHFGLYFDRNGDGLWTKDEVVDPYGWQGSGRDPWSNASRYLWRQPLSSQQIIRDSDASLHSQSQWITATVPGTASQYPLLVELWEVPSEVWKGEARSMEAPSPWRSSGRSFRLTATQFDASTEAEEQSRQLTSVENQDSPITLSVAFGDESVSRLDPTQLTIRRWDERQSAWLSLTTTVDMEHQVATAQTAELGQFDLYAPVLCLNDSYEPDDHYAAALALPATTTTVRRGFDTPEDTDWFRVDIQGDGFFVAQISQLTESVDAALSIHRVDTLATLASSDSRRNRGSPYLKWQAPEAGPYLVRVSRIGSSPSISTCEETYVLSTKLVYAPDKVAIAGPEIGFVENGYAFTATVSPMTATQPITFVWQVQDNPDEAPTLSISDALTFTWTTTGTHLVLVTATNEAGVITGSHDIDVHGPLAAAFSASPVFGSPPLQVTFENASSEGYLESWWDFGDGKASNAENPSHTYKEHGIYTVTLTVNGPGGRDTLTKTAFITVEHSFLPGEADHSVFLPLIFRND